MKTREQISKKLASSEGECGVSVGRHLSPPLTTVHVDALGAEPGPAPMLFEEDERPRGLRARAKEPMDEE